MKILFLYLPNFPIRVHMYSLMNKVCFYDVHNVQFYGTVIEELIKLYFHY